MTKLGIKVSPNPAYTFQKTEQGPFQNHATNFMLR